MKRALFLSLFFLASSAHAETVIVSCHGSSPKFPQAYFELFEAEDGKLASAYTMGSLPLYYPTWTRASEATTPPKILITLLKQMNDYRPTAIDPGNVKLFQNVFIDGSNSFAVEMWKLMDEHGVLLGWAAHAYGEVIGCY